MSTSPPVYYNNEQIRIVMVGKTGVKIRDVGNIILGKQCFRRNHKHLACVDMAEYCEKAVGKVEGQKVAVIRPPDPSDTRYTEEKTNDGILNQYIKYASPGPHIFLVVIEPYNFTEKEKQTLQKIQEIFGMEADKCMVLFNYQNWHFGKTIEKLLEDNQDLQELVTKCNGQYHVFYYDMKERSQVRELLKKIKNITEKNGGNHYTNETFQEIERVIQKETQ